MLAALTDVEPQTARRALSAAARWLLPNPELERPETEQNNLNEIAKNIVKEISQQVRAPSEGERQSRVYEALSKEITRTLLAGTDAAAIRARVGQKGHLPVSLYQILFSPKFESRIGTWGLKKVYVENAIRHADMIQHLFPTVQDVAHTAVTSLFVQTPETQGPKYSVLVVCDRNGSTLIVDSAWRVYHDEVELIGAVSPLDVLTRFAQKFGNEMEIAGEKSKLIVAKVMRVARNQIVTQSIADGDKIEFVPNTEKDEADFEIVLSYSIKDGPYFDQLRRHNVIAEMPNTKAFALSSRQTTPQVVTT
jgi:hypothetical protein